jgi:hypothetical protein
MNRALTETKNKRTMGVTTSFGGIGAGSVREGAEYALEVAKTQVREYS